ncbi:inositol monophosphatase family protein [Marisediminicola senii]|uniref:inositol monophosphatase family protein n=1 Tax=Marisediminicola senii TaxID=2711233 RepID=UPI002E2A06B4|nr:inositol monophosphatase family protein [Marisediminicola senii]
MTEYSLQSDLLLARELADMADSIAIDRFRANDLLVTMKPDMTHVTDADKAVEAAIRGGLADSRPGDSILGEEFGGDAVAAGSVGAAGRRQWIIDPIDGTANYVRGIPVWATLISLAIDGVPVVGVVSAPALRQRWWAATGQGAWTSEYVSQSERSERRIFVSGVTELADASLSYNSLKGWDDEGRLDQLTTLSREVWRTRAYGDMWSYMMVADGLVDIAGEFDLKPYDMAALVPIVEEAGGRFSSADGASGPWGGSAIATNGLLHDRVLEIVAGDR